VTSSPGLRILTANLRHRFADAAAFGEMLDRVDPDVVAVQELALPAAREIESRFEHHRLTCSPDRNGIGLAARRPAELRDVDLGGSAAVAAELAPSSWPAPASPLLVVTLHLANPVAWPPWRMVAALRRQVEALRAEVEHRDRVAVVGDFNATPRWPAYRQIAGFLDDGVLGWARRSGSVPPRTWGPLRAGPKLLRIDHILVRGVRVVDCRRVLLPGSDHAGLLADLTL